MVKFIGEHKAKLDDKGRLIFPSAFKSLMEGEQSMLLVVKKDLYANCLNIYTYSEWERESEALKAKLNFFDQEHCRFWRTYVSNRALIEPDEKLGRINIPKELLSSINIDKEVIFCGNDHKIELWAKEAYSNIHLGNDEFISIVNKLQL